MNVKMKNFAYEIFKQNNKKIVSLFGKDIKDGEIVDVGGTSYKLYSNYYRFVSEILKAYRAVPAETQDGDLILAPCAPEKLTPAEREDVAEMIEVIIDTIYYAKHKGQKNEV